MLCNGLLGGMCEPQTAHLGTNCWGEGEGDQTTSDTLLQIFMFLSLHLHSELMFHGRGDVDHLRGRGRHIQEVLKVNAIALAHKDVPRDHAGGERGVSEGSGHEVSLHVHPDGRVYAKIPSRNLRVQLKLSFLPVREVILQRVLVRGSDLHRDTTDAVTERVVNAEFGFGGVGDVFDARRGSGGGGGNDAERHGF